LSDLAADCTFALYRFAGRVGAPLVRILLRRRAAAGREDPARLGERWGLATAERPPGPLIWIHGASVGESLSALPLIRTISARWPQVTVLLTTGTVSAARLLAEPLPDGVIHQYAPVDLPAAVARFLDHWKPSLGIFIESELWPEMVTRAAALDITLILVNGRMSSRSAARWGGARPLIGRLLGRFSLVLAQTPHDATRLRDLGAAAPLYVGNLKSTAPALDANASDLADFTNALHGRPCWLAASTHPGEELSAGRVHIALTRRFPGLLTLIAPRHPERATDIAAALKAQGLKVARRSEGQRPGPDDEIYVADVLGQMGLWYRLAGVVFVGGSLTPEGGHNPLEPARLRCAMVTGPHCENFAQIAEEMTADGALCRVRDDDELAERVGALLGDPEARGMLAAAAESYALAQADTLDKIVEALRPHLDQVAGGGPDTCA
jgi:3-deoxy-D-manno-octulosonic-acid transferase